MRVGKRTVSDVLELQRLPSDQIEGPQDLQLIPSTSLQRQSFRWKPLDKYVSSNNAYLTKHDPHELLARWLEHFLSGTKPNQMFGKNDKKDVENVQEYDVTTDYNPDILSQKREAPRETPSEKSFERPRKNYRYHLQKLSNGMSSLEDADFFEDIEDSNLNRGGFFVASTMPRGWFSARLREKSRRRNMKDFQNDQNGYSHDFYPLSRVMTSPNQKSQRGLLESLQNPNLSVKMPYRNTKKRGLLESLQNPNLSVKMPYRNTKKRGLLERLQNPNQSVKMPYWVK